MPSSVTPAELARVLDQRLLLDVRRKTVYEEAADILPGALWRDPGGLEAWAATLPAGETVVVYCVHGHRVSQGVASRLEELGFDVRYLEGGIEGWREAGMEVEPRLS